MRSRGLESVILVVILWFPSHDARSQGDEGPSTEGVILAPSGYRLPTTCVADSPSCGDGSPSRGDFTGSAAERGDSASADAAQGAVSAGRAPVSTGDGSVPAGRASEDPPGDPRADGAAASAAARRDDAAAAPTSAAPSGRTPPSDASRTPSPQGPRSAAAARAPVSARVEPSLRAIPSAGAAPASLRTTEPLLAPATAPSDGRPFAQEDDGASRGEREAHAERSAAPPSEPPPQEPALNDKDANREDALLTVRDGGLLGERMSQMSAGVRDSVYESAEHSAQGDDTPPSQEPLLREVSSVQSIAWEVSSPQEQTPASAVPAERDCAPVAETSVQQISPSAVQAEQRLPSHEPLSEAETLSPERTAAAAETEATPGSPPTRPAVEPPAAAASSGDDAPPASPPARDPPGVVAATDEDTGEAAGPRPEATTRQAEEAPASAEPATPEAAAPAADGDEDRLLKPGDIPSFDEWKKKVLEEEKEKQDQVLPAIPILLPPVVKKSLNNYASMECGAKILSANPEAQSTSTILMENKDLYMLNPCSAKIWFVIELCEPVQVKQIDIGNLELFSSTPRDFAVSISDRYPIREWVKVGTLHARDERMIQSFPLDQKMYAMFLKMFTKYVKVELVSHHGSEHFCPISLIRVLGVSMVEEYDEIDETRYPDPAADELHDEDRDIAIGLGNPNENSSDNNLLGSATNAILTMVNMAAKVLGGNKGDKEIPGAAVEDRRALLGNASWEQSAAVIGSDQEGLIRVPKDKVAVTRDDRRPRVTTLDDLTLSTEPRKELTRLLLPTKGPFSKTDEYLSEDRLSQCHPLTLLDVLMKRCPRHTSPDYTASARYESLPVGSRSLSQVDGALTASRSPANEPDAPPACESAAVAMPSAVVEEIDAGASAPVTADPVIPAPTDTVLLPAHSSAELTLAAGLGCGGGSSNSGDVITATPISDGTDVSGGSDATAPGQDNASQFSCAAISGHALEVEEMFTASVEPSGTTLREAAAAPGVEPARGRMEVAPGATAEQAADAAEPPATIPDAGRPPDRDARQQEGTASEEEVQQQQPPIPVAKTGEEARVDSAQADVYPDAGDLSAASAASLALGAAQKESVFMRLSNRIRALELNMSLSSRYLEEVSQRYRRQMEEMQRSFDRTIAKLLDSSRAAEEQVVQQEHLVEELQARVENATASLVAVAQSVQRLQREVSTCHLHVLLASEALALLLLLALCLWFCKRAPDGVRAVESPLGDADGSFMPDAGMKNSSSNTEPSDVTSSSSQTIGVAVKSSPRSEACGGATPRRPQRSSLALATRSVAVSPRCTPPAVPSTAAATAAAAAAATAATAAIRFSDSESPSSPDEPDEPGARGSFFCGTLNVGACGGLCGGGGGDGKHPSRAKARDRQGWPLRGRPARAEAGAALAAERRTRLPARGSGTVAKANGGVANN